MTGNRKKYSVCFYDMFDGWTTPLKEFNEDEFEEAKKYADEQMKKLDSNNKSCGEHYGVIDHSISREVYCTQYARKW